MRRKNLSGVEVRIRALKIKIDQGCGCNCRRPGVTSYHTAADLSAILASRCPVHDFRELGEFQWVPTSMPLGSGDQSLCTCAASATRDFLQNKRGPLTYAEQLKEQSILQQELTADADQRFMVDQAKVKYLIDQYERHKNQHLLRATEIANCTRELPISRLR